MSTHVVIDTNIYAYMLHVMPATSYAAVQEQTKVKLEPASKDLDKQKKESQSKADKCTYTTDLDFTPPVMIKFGAGYALEKVPLLKGCNGFLVAEFADGTKRETELPNIVLERILTPPHSKRARTKAKAKSSRKKKKGPKLAPKKTSRKKY